MKWEKIISLIIMCSGIADDYYICLLLEVRSLLPMFAALRGRNSKLDVFSAGTQVPDIMTRSPYMHSFVLKSRTCMRY
jgi:hypothetical protein